MFVIPNFAAISCDGKLPLEVEDLDQLNSISACWSWCYWLHFRCCSSFCWLCCWSFRAEAGVSSRSFRWSRLRSSWRYAWFLYFQHWQLEHRSLVSGTAGCAGVSAVGTSTTELPLGASWVSAAGATGTACYLRPTGFDKSLTATVLVITVTRFVVKSALATAVASVAPAWGSLVPTEVTSFDHLLLFSIQYLGRSNPCCWCCLSFANITNIDSKALLRSNSSIKFDIWWV